MENGQDKLKQETDTEASLSYDFQSRIKSSRKTVIIVRSHILIAY